MFCHESISTLELAFPEPHFQLGFEEDGLSHMYIGSLRIVNQAYGYSIFRFDSFEISHDEEFPDSGPYCFFRFYFSGVLVALVAVIDPTI